MDFATFLRRLGENIRKARWLAGLTQEDVAAASGITYRHYQGLERGRVNPTTRTLFDLSKVLKRSVAELLDIGSAPARRTRLRELEATPPPRGRRPTRGRT